MIHAYNPSGYIELYFLFVNVCASCQVCRNESSHLRGNVYVQFKSVDSAISAYNGMNGRFYAGKQVSLVCYLSFIEFNMLWMF